MKQILADVDGVETWIVTDADKPHGGILNDMVDDATARHERATANTHRVLAGPSWRETVRIVNRD